MSNYFLEHYGVKGMRWGKRKAQPQISGPTSNSGGSTYNSNAFKSSGKQSRYKDAHYTEVGGSSGSNSRKSRPEYRDNPKPAGDSTSSLTKTNTDFDAKQARESLKGGKKMVDAGAGHLAKERKQQTAKQLKANAKDMSDEELRAIVSRLSMEEKYISAMEKDGYGASKGDLEKTLEMVGTAVSYADTALSIYSTIQDIRGRK